MEGVQVIWLNTILGEAEPKELEDFFKSEGYTVKFEEEFIDKEDSHHIIFSVLDNIGSFCLYRLKRIDMKWLDDFYDNYSEILPEEIIQKYHLRKFWEE